MAEDLASAFDLAVFLVASARDTLEATPAYGALRLVDAITRLAPLSDDDFVRDLAAKAEQARSLLMDDAAAFAAALDELLSATAAEAKRRNQR
jgi:hypothetical protein